ncbi:MAG: S28 family serine protease [Marinifilaceae bacterium]
MMRVLHLILVALLLTTGNVFAEGVLKARLKQIKQVSEIKEIKVDGFKEYYTFFFDQPIDHSNPTKGQFKQLVYLGHKTDKAPVVVELQGYGMYSTAQQELAQLLNGNQLVIEHRFFDASVPAGNIPWEYLTLKQSATDQHIILTALKENIYSNNKWISTGISKGGQTAIYHRYFYPEDVDVTVPYVAPFNLDYVDKRLDSFLSSLGVSKTGFRSVFEGNGGEGVDYVIKDFQTHCFENIKQLLPLAETDAKKKGYTFDHVNGVERALQLAILEFPFAFWQWGHSGAIIPVLEEASMKQIYETLVKVSGLDFFDDASIKRLYPFYYAALTETGMYDYKIGPFKRFLDDKTNITFEFAYPKDAPKKPFNKEQMAQMNKWLQTSAEKMMFIYGGIDPWSGTAVDLKKNDKCYKIMMSDKDHKCRIKDLDMITQQHVIEVLKEWIQ